MNLLTKLEYHSILAAMTQIILIIEMLNCHIEKTNNHLLLKTYKSNVKKIILAKKMINLRNHFC
jgi:hypothetical protein